MDSFLLLIVAAAGLVWTVWFILRGSLLAGCLAAIITSACTGYPFWHAEVGPLPLTADRAVVALVAAAYVVHRRFGLADPKPLGRAEWVLIALLGVLAASVFSHDWRDRHAQPVAHLVLYWLMPAVLYWAARQAPLTQRALRWTLGALGIFCVYLTATALAEASGQWWAVLPRYISSPKFEYFGRARGPFMNPAAMGVYLTVCLAAALTFWPRLGRLGQLGLLAFTALGVTAIGSTLTRSAWLGGALGLALFAGLILPRAWRRTLIATGLAAAIVLVVARWDDVWNLKRDVRLDAAAAADSAQLRPILAQVAWNMFLDRPLFGCGFDQYDSEKLPYLSDRTSQLPLEKSRPYVQHNAFLALLTQTGLAGTGLFVVLLACWTRMGWRLWTSLTAPDEARYCGLLLLTLLAAYLPNAMFHDTNIIEGVNLLIFFAAGLASGLYAIERPEAQSAPYRPVLAPRCRVATA